MNKRAPLEFEGHQYLRQVLLLSLLSQRQVIVKNIRPAHENPGLRNFETNLLNLLQKVTNGCQLNINKTGTKLIFMPGQIDCNDGLPIEHVCDLSRGMSYYLEVVVILSIFGKSNLTLRLEGNTDDPQDQSVESLKSFFGYALTHFGHQNAINIQVKKRGYSPLGGGLVHLYSKYAKVLHSISLSDEGKVKRVRGLLSSARVSPQLTTRVVDKAREVFNDYIPDVWVHTDHYKKEMCGQQPGYALSLVAETSTGVVLTKDYCFQSKMKLPEELGELASLGLLDEIFSGGVVDSTNQPWLLLLMSLTSSEKGPSQAKLGRVTEQGVAMLRNVRKFLNVQFKIGECEDEEEDSDSDDGEQGEGKEENQEMEEEGEQVQKTKCFMFSCLGIGLQNIARKAD